MKRFLALACIVSVLASPVAAQSDSEWEGLRESFANLYKSLEAKGGIAPQDIGVIRTLRDRAAEFVAEHRDNEQALAMELQLSMWLEDFDRVDALFARLAEVTGDVNVGVAWARYFRRLDDTKRVAAIYSRLADLFPDDIEVRVTWADYYKGANLYDRAIEILESADLDPAEDPQAVLTLSECLFAEHRFAEALAAIDSIPQETLDADPAVARLVEQVRPARESYVDLWAAEQEIRAAEASADDLPRARLETAQGPIVVELFENEAPNTVANFIVLADSGFYEGTRFHRVIPNFMAQGGDPNSRPEATGPVGQGGPGYRIRDEHGREDARNHFTGSLAMANIGEPDTGGSQFYLTHTPPADLNGKHTVFGRVLDGLDVVRALEPDDTLVSVTILRRRDHDYTVEEIAESDTQAPVTPITPPVDLPNTSLKLKIQDDSEAGDE